MAEVKPPVVVNLTWESGLKFVARDAAHEWVLDGRNEGGPSPVVALGAALAGLHGHRPRPHPDARAVRGAGAEGGRSPASGPRREPRRFVKVDLRFTIDTSAPDDQIARAIALSHDKYCSVWHSMRPDIAFTTSFENRV